MTTAPTQTAAQPRFQINPLALSSFVLSLLWFVVTPFLGNFMDENSVGLVLRLVLGGIGSIAAIVLGTLAQRQMDRSTARQTGRGYAAAGIILGWFGVLIALGVNYWFLLPDAPGV